MKTQVPKSNMPLVPLMLNHSCAQLSFSQSESWGYLW